MLTTAIQNAGASPPLDVPLTMDLIPNEIVLLFFQKMTNPWDFVSLGVTCKRFHQIALMQKAASNVTIPSYISRSSVPQIRELTAQQKSVRAARIEDKILADEPFEIVHQLKNLPGSRDGEPLPKRLIGDYLVLASIHDPQATGIVRMDHLKTKGEIEFKAHEHQVTAVDLIQSELGPLLFTFASEEGIKIWDFTQLVTAENEAIVFQLLTNTINTYAIDRHLLGVADGDSVKIWDWSKRDPLQFFTIDLPGVKQIEFTETHIILVTSTLVAMWEIPKVFDPVITLRVNSACYTYELNHRHWDSWNHSRIYAKIKFVKIYKDFLAIAYSENYLVEGERVLGEVRNWKTKECVRMLHQTAYSRGTFELNAIDFWDDWIVAGSSFPIVWDLKAEGNLQFTHDERFWQNEIRQVAILGQHVLFVDTGGCLIKEMNKGFENALWNDHMLGVDNSDGRIRLNSFHFDQYFMTEVQEGKNSRTLTVLNA